MPTTGGGGLCRLAPRNDDFFNDFVCYEVFAGVVSADDGLDEGLGHVGVVGQQLFGVFGQAVAAVAETWVVIVGADAGV